MAALCQALVGDDIRHATAKRSSACTTCRAAGKTSVRTLNICNKAARNPVGIDMLAQGTNQQITPG
jgi:hypothetical protein